MREYHSARERINQFIKETTGSLKNDLDLLAKERARINIELIDAWFQGNKELVPDFESYINLRDTERKLGDAFKKYWHTVFIYRSIYFLTENIKYSKIISLEYFFFTKSGILSKSGIEPGLKVDSQNKSQSLFYKNPLSHFFGYKILTEILSRSQAPLTPNILKTFSLVPTYIFDAFQRFETVRDGEVKDHFELKNHLEDDPFLSQVMDIIDKNHNGI